MSPTLQLVLALGIIIFVAKSMGYVSVRLGQPAVLGELLAGLVLGPTMLNLFQPPIFSDKHLTEVIFELGDLGVIFLMFIAGLEVDLKAMIQAGRVSTLTGVLGVFAPIALAIPIGIIFGLSLSEGIFIGIILAATSVSISAQTLMELNVLRSRVGISLLGAAVFDDILVVLGLSAFTALVLAETPGGLERIIVVLTRMALFLFLASALGWLVLPRASRRITNLPISQGLIAFTIVVILLYGWAAEELGGMAGITGAFLAGLLFARSSVKERIESGIVSLAYGLFVPIFFINVGLTANLRELWGNAFWLFVAMTGVAVLGKVIGAGSGALLGGLNRQEALQLGIGMMSRGEVGLIVASVGVAQGLIDEVIFSAVVGVVIITTLLTPPLLRASFSKTPSPARESGVEVRPAAKGETE